MSISLDEPLLSQSKKRAEFIVLFEDLKTKITSWRFDPGDETGWHHHNYDYVTIQKSSGRLKLESEDGEVKFITYHEDKTDSYKAPIKHNATNVSNEEVRVIEIEYKI